VRAVGSPVTDVAVVVVRLFGCVGGEGRATWDLGVVGASAVEALRLCPGGLVCWRQVDHFSISGALLLKKFKHYTQPLHN
jgi:hypothetical protein